MEDYQDQYLNQQMKDFRKGKTIYVCSYTIISTIEKQIMLERVPYHKRKVYNSMNGVVMYSFTKEEK